MVDFSLILPTRERPALVQRLFQNLLETTSDPESLEVILYVDEDDNESAQITHPLLRLVKLIGPRKSMGMMTQACYRASHGRFIVLINDDMVIRTKDWDLAVKNAFSRYSDEIAMVYPNDGYYGPKVSTFPILTRKTCEAMGEIVPAAYRRHCIDSHLFDLFERLKKRGFNRLSYLPDLVFEHMQFGLSFENAGKSDKTHQDDQIRFLDLAGERDRIAQKLAQRIGSSVKKSAQFPPISLMIPILGDDDSRKMEVCLSSLVASLHDGLWPEVTLIVGPSAPVPKLSRVLKHSVQMCRSQSSGLGRILNEAVVGTNHELLVFLGAGCAVESGWLRALVCATSDSQVGAVGSMWLEPRSGRVEQAGLAFYEHEDGLSATHLYRGLRSDHPTVKRSRSLQAIEWEGMLVRRSVFNQVGGFSSLAYGLEHIDLCGKIRTAEFRVNIAPDAIIYRAIKQPAPCIPSDWPRSVRADLNSILKADEFALQSASHAVV